MECKICGGASETVFEAVVLNRYKAVYELCRACGFLFVRNPGWLREAYKNPINLVDTGILQRNINLAEKVSVLISAFFDRKAAFLDFAGGYGVFVRLMRDYGFNCFWHDPYTRNIFAQGFEYNNSHSIELLTTFESFEHFVSPRAEIEKMLKISKNILFTTTLLPQPVPAPQAWWYYGLEHGQHVSFYSEKSLRSLANSYGLNYYTYGSYLHLFTSRKISNLWFKTLLRLPLRGFSGLLYHDLTPKTVSDKEFLTGKKA